MIDREAPIRSRPRFGLVAAGIFLLASLGGAAWHETTAASSGPSSPATSPDAATPVASATPAGPAASAASGAGKPARAARGTRGLEVRPATAALLAAEIRRPGAKVTLVNVWATWCAPCREEFPEIVRLERAWRDRGLRVMFVSADFVDQRTAVRRFLAAQGVTAPTWIKTGDDTEFINALTPKWSGALPATLIYDARGTLVQFWEGRADYDRFESEVRGALQPAKSPM